MLIRWIIAGLVACAAIFAWAVHDPVQDVERLATPTRG